MKQVFNTVAQLLLRAAHGRAEQVMHVRAQAHLNAAEDYRSNAGGWN